MQLSGLQAEESYFTDRLTSQLEQLKREQGLRGVAFFPQANQDKTSEEIAASASAMLDSYLSGKTMDITDIVK